MGTEHNVANEELSKLLESDNGCEYTVIGDSISFKSGTDPGSFNVLHINIRSLHKNVDSLTVLLSDLRDAGVIIDAIGLCETFLTETSLSLVDIENYSGLHKVRCNHSSGGVSLYIHDSVKLVKEVKVPFNEAYEACAAELEYKSKKILLCKFYRPPNSNDKLFLASFKRSLTNFVSYKTCFLCLDQNYDLLKLHLYRPTQEFVETLYDSKFLLTILKPTRVTHVSSTLIDNIFVKSSALNHHSSFVVTDPMSDHFPCLLFYRLSNYMSDQSDLVIEKRNQHC